MVYRGDEIHHRTELEATALAHLDSVRQRGQPWSKLRHNKEYAQQTVDVDDSAYNLNYRPRKCLGYSTPHEVFYNLPMRPLS